MPSIDSIFKKQEALQKKIEGVWKNCWKTQMLFSHTAKKICVNNLFIAIASIEIYMFMMFIFMSLALLVDVIE